MATSPSNTHSVLVALRGRLLGNAGGDGEGHENGSSLSELWSTYTASVETKIASEYRLSPQRIQQQQQVGLGQGSKARHNSEVTGSKRADARRGS